MLLRSKILSQLSKVKSTFFPNRSDYHFCRTNVFCWCLFCRSCLHCKNICHAVPVLGKADEQRTVHKTLLKFFFDLVKAEVEFLTKRQVLQDNIIFPQFYMHFRIYSRLFPDFCMFVIIFSSTEVLSLKISFYISQFCLFIVTGIGFFPNCALRPLAFHSVIISMYCKFQ